MVVGVVVWSQHRYEAEPYATGFDLIDGRTAEALAHLRQRKDLAIVVHDGICADDDERPPA